ncbi:uncharacterized protein TNCV_2302591 [Trichonephila clavipes]|nr:uncharacterized protein TNCV_2302591 [Trichonephila clavipes]
MKAKRLNWAKQWRDKDVDFWRSVCCYNLFTKCLTIFYDYRKNRSASVMKAHLKFCRAMLSLCVVVGEKSFILCCSDCETPYKKIMIWPVISGNGTGRLYVVKGMMRIDQYKDVLQNCLIPQLEEWFPNGEPYIFMQDGSQCHTARSIEPFLAEQGFGQAEPFLAG